MRRYIFTSVEFAFKTLKRSHQQSGDLFQQRSPKVFEGAPSINVNSVKYFIGYVDTNDMNFESEKRKFSSLKGYLSSKLAQVMVSSILQKNLPDGSGISVVCVAPGSGLRSTPFAATDSDVPKYCTKLKTDVWPVCAYMSYSCNKMSTSKEAHRTDTLQAVWEKTLDMVRLPADFVEMLLQGKEIQCWYGAHPN
ncbi:NAD(P)-binding Rossmann-fold superfamily protein [Actinidia rufa]|uniref:NAD(P)-binding Rossmann-fold superfamily protein n=1 Tax=Actinidia rufa TaxID=165716 RepID=A0A7J0H373_9ERIC|nr:NAD(P)-binding Rossmann-fold superfamily protein [Actinidia rufa]